jgi:hypothetical protein
VANDLRGYFGRSLRGSGDDWNRLQKGLGSFGGLRPVP